MHLSYSETVSYKFSNEIVSQSDYLYWFDLLYACIIKVINYKLVITYNIKVIITLIIT